MRENSKCHYKPRPRAELFSIALAASFTALLVFAMFLASLAPILAQETAEAVRSEVQGMLENASFACSEEYSEGSLQVMIDGKQMYCRLS